MRRELPGPLRGSFITRLCHFMWQICVVPICGLHKTTNRSAVFFIFFYHKERSLPKLQNYFLWNWPTCEGLSHTSVWYSVAGAPGNVAHACVALCSVSCPIPRDVEALTSTGAAARLFSLEGMSPMNQLWLWSVVQKIFCTKFHLKRHAALWKYHHHEQH